MTGTIADSCAASRILIIDDDASVTFTVSRVLERAGFTNVEATTDPFEGLVLFERQPPDLVLIDLHMPGLSGLEVLQRLRTLVPSVPPIPIVMLTGDRDASRKRQALAMGASDFLLKPFDAVEVALCVRARLETRSLHQRLANHNRELEARVVDRTRDLEAMQLEMLQRLAVATELRDDDTGQHTYRVGQLAGQLAQALGLELNRVELIARAAPLHDLGKIGIPDAILRKPGKLTDAEYEEMKGHAAIGARILSGGHSELIQFAERIAHSHHERWDGTGYPMRLAGEQIPLEARIVAVADFYDALTHERPYRPAFTIARTLMMIAEGSGTHFDPAIAQAILTLPREPVESA